MEWMGEELGFEAKLFELQGQAWQLAGYYALEKGGLDAFVDRMRVAFHSPEAVRLRAASAQHQALARRSFRTIYTTNFEHHVEDTLLAAGKRLCGSLGWRIS